MFKLVFRKANYDDVDAIHNNLKLCSEDMYNKHGLEHWIPVYPQERIKEDIDTKQVFVVENEGNIVGNFILTNNGNPLWKEESNSIYLSKLAVAPQYAGHGIGKECMKFIEEMAKQQGFESVRFDVYDKSMDTIAFYEKVNYLVVGTANTRRFTVLLMEKRI